MFPIERGTPPLYTRRDGREITPHPVSGVHDHWHPRITCGQSVYGGFLRRLIPATGEVSTRDGNNNGENVRECPTQIVQLPDASDNISHDPLVAIILSRPGLGVLAMTVHTYNIS
jgi:hypothetical protein